MACHAKNCASCLSDVVWEKPKIEDICTSPDREFATLEEMVNHYNKSGLAKTEKWLQSLTYGQPEELWFTNFICGEANILRDPDDKKFCKNSHQYRMPYTTVLEARTVLESTNFESINTFDGILRKVIDVTKPVENFGLLCAYDFTLRYGFSRNILPEKVYVHAGTKIGLTALAEIYPNIKTSRDKIVGEIIDASLLPTVLAELGCLHIENFLCIYDGQLKTLAKKSNQ